ncbi:MAG: hypothetical protein ACTHM2_09610 [Afipia sp.]
MTGTEDLISKWTAQMAEFRADAEAKPPGSEREDLLRRVELCRRAIESAESLALTRVPSTSIQPNPR